MQDVGPLAGLLNRQAADLTLSVQVQEGIFVQVLGFDDTGRTELDRERIRLLKRANLQGAGPRSKNA